MPGEVHARLWVARRSFRTGLGSHGCGVWGVGMLVPLAPRAALLKRKEAVSNAALAGGNGQPWPFLGGRACHREAAQPSLGWGPCQESWRGGAAPWLLGALTGWPGSTQGSL